MEETRNGKITKKVYITNESNLTWEVEDTDKIIIPLNENDWSIQFDNELPIQLTLESDFFIPKNTYHRLIKGSEDLVVEIYDYLATQRQQEQREQSGVAELAMDVASVEADDPRFKLIE